MILYHGTSKSNLDSIIADGVTAPSYWGTSKQAEEFANSFGSDGVIISSDIDEDSLSASMLMADALYEDGDIDEMPESTDLDFSIEHLGGVTCDDTITIFDVL